MTHAQARGKTPAPARLTTARGAAAEIEGEVIVVRDRRGAVVFRFDAETGEARVEAPGGDLVLAAPNGNVRVEAGADLELIAKGASRVASAEIELSAAVVATHARRILEHAGEIYREVDDVVHTRAGRVRSLVKDAYQLLAGRTSITSDEETSIDGKKVLLG